MLLTNEIDYNYLGHNFKVMPGTQILSITKTVWLLCNNCKIICCCFKTNLVDNFTFYDNKYSIMENLTCAEVIIKEIIE